VFKPIYEITNKLLFNIKKIGTIVFELNNKRFPEIIKDFLKLFYTNSKEVQEKSQLMHQPA